MTTEQAINVLVQAVALAQTKGAFTLTDADAVLQALKALDKKPEEKAEEKKD